MKSEKSSSRPKGSGGLPNATSATLRTVAANPPRSWTVRIIKPVFYAFILLLAARFTVVYLLPKNRFLFREFTFQANDSESHSHQSRLWDHFGQHQENIILELAQNSSPTLSRELIVNSSHFHPDKLVIRISCPYRDEKLAEGFRRLIIDYTKQRSLIEAEWAADNRQTQTKSETLTPDQIRQSEEYNRRLQELILLQSEYARIDAQSVAYEHQLSPAKSANEPIGFSEFIKPYVQNALAFDDQWCHLNQWLNKLRRQRAELDIKCGQCDSAEQLEKLLQQREQIELRYNQEKRNLNQRRELIADMVRLECRGRYQEQLKTKIQESQLALIANSDQQLVLKMEIDCLKNHSDHPKPSPAPPANPTNTIKNSSHSSEDTDTNADTNITV
ncbi:MAG: hypothetical protein KAT56_05650, partial [Sedimentisphaerales bacterium]|nr:hypothetical protein [Sedimentisphaerales bacterium]